MLEDNNIKFEFPLPLSPHTSKINPAQWTYEKLVEMINKFERNLDDEHEIGARLVSFGQEIKFHIMDMGYYGPEIITFEGTNENNEPIKLIQHYQQLSVLLIAMKKINEKPKRIGFELNEGLNRKEEN